MRTGEKTRARLEQLAGKLVRKAAPLMGEKLMAAKGASMEIRGRARRMRATARARRH